MRANAHREINYGAAYTGAMSPDGAVCVRPFSVKATSWKSLRLAVLLVEVDDQASLLRVFHACHSHQSVQHAEKDYDYGGGGLHAKNDAKDTWFTKTT